MITSKEIAAMSLSEKMQIMEMIWDDLSRPNNSSEEFPSPAWHDEILKSRASESRDRRNYKDWEQAKIDILNSVNENYTS